MCIVFISYGFALACTRRSPGATFSVTQMFPLDENNNPIKGIARHPIIEDDVIIYSNATILGRITIGKGAVIGGNIWVTENVAPGERLVQAKAKP